MAVETAATTAVEMAVETITDGGDGGVEAAADRRSGVGGGG